MKTIEFCNIDHKQAFENACSVLGLRYEINPIHNNYYKIYYNYEAELFTLGQMYWLKKGYLESF